MSLERVDFIGNLKPFCETLVDYLGFFADLLALVSRCRYKALPQLVLRRKCMVEMGAVMQFICLKSENPDHCRRPLIADCQSSIAQLLVV